MESYCGIWDPLNWVMGNSLNEFPLLPFNIYDYILFQLSISIALDNLNSSVIIKTKETGENIFSRGGDSYNYDSGSFQRWWYGVSGVAVKATSDPWLIWRTPSMTTVSSEKHLYGYVQSTESQSQEPPSLLVRGKQWSR